MYKWSSAATIDAESLPCAARLPLHFARHQVGTPDDAAVFRIAVEVIAHQHDSAVLVAQLGFERIHDFHLDFAVSAGNLLQQGSATTVAGDKEHQVASDDGRGNDGGGFVDVERPKQLAVAGSHTHRTAARRLHVHARAADVGDNDRRMAGAAVVWREADQRFSPVFLSSATIVFVGPPGVQTSWSPSMVTDSLYPQPSAFLPSKSFFRSFRHSSSPLVLQQISAPCGVMT